jgi:hypothetical protein
MAVPRRLAMLGAIMAFDASNPNRPLVSVHRSTAQAELWMMIAAVIFFIGCTLLTEWMHSRRSADRRSPSEQHGRP